MSSPLENISQISQQEIRQIEWVLNQFVQQFPKNEVPGRKRLWEQLHAKIVRIVDTLARIKSGQAFITPDTTLLAIRRDENLACAKLVCPRCAANEPFDWSREGQACHGTFVCRATKLHERLKVEMAK